MAALDATPMSNHSRGYCPLNMDSLHLYVMRYLPNNTYLFSLYLMLLHIANLDVIAIIH
jgi:hypothetical protein